MIIIIKDVRRNDNDVRRRVNMIVDVGDYNFLFVSERNKERRDLQKGKIARFLAASS